MSAILTAGAVEIFIGGRRVPLSSISYGSVAKPARPERVMVSGRYDFECVFLVRPQPVIRDGLSGYVVAGRAT